MKPFSSQWWESVGEKALYKFNNYAWHSHYYEIAEYCFDRAEKAFWREVKVSKIVKL